MAQASKIEWTDATWNPVTGCTKISPGCKHCYAERLALRLQAMGNPRYVNGFEVTLHPDLVNEPLKWRQPRIIFVNSMSDLFHKDVPDKFIHRLFQVMVKAPWHIFQVLTKRPERVAEMASRLPWPSNVWVGTSIENQKHTFRIDSIRKVPASVHFLSIEPLIGPLSHLPLEGIDWVIVGGESGPGARYMDPDWVRSIRDRCIDAGIPFFFKQWGGVHKSRYGRMLDGRTWDEMPSLSSTKESKLVQDRLPLRA